MEQTFNISIPLAMIGFSYVLIIIAAILLIVTSQRLNNLRAVNTDEANEANFKNVSDKLDYAQIFAWIVLGLSIFFFMSLVFPNIWLQVIMLILIVAAIVTFLVFTILAYTSIDSSNSDLTELIRNDMGGYLIAAIVLISVGLAMLIGGTIWLALIPYVAKKKVEKAINQSINQSEYGYVSQTQVVENPNGKTVPAPSQVPPTRINYQYQTNQKSQMRIMTPPTSPIRVVPPRNNIMNTPRRTFASTPTQQQSTRAVNVVNRINSGGARNVRNVNGDVITKPKPKVLSPFGF